MLMEQDRADHASKHASPFSAQAETAHGEEGPAPAGAPDDPAADSGTASDARDSRATASLMSHWGESGSPAPASSPRAERAMDARAAASQDGGKAWDFDAPWASLQGAGSAAGSRGRDGRGQDGGDICTDQRKGKTSAKKGGAKGPPKPIAVRNGPSHAPIDTSTAVGMRIAITLTSSTGKDADMASIEDSEQVGLSEKHTGSFKGMAAMPSNTSSWMPGHPIPDDNHTFPKATIIDRCDNHGGDGSFEKQQLDIWRDTANGVTERAIPASGYIIKRSIIKGKGNKIKFRTEKRPAAVSVNGFSSTAGPSAKQSEDVKVR